jgi:hypothetical protein
MKKALLALFCIFTFSVLQAQKGDFHLDEVYKISKNGTLDLRCSDAKVYITGGNRIDAHVKIDRTVTTKGVTFGQDRFTVDVNETSGNLVIQEHSSSVNVGVVGYYSEKYKIEIDLPTSVSLKIKGDDGDYFIKNIDGKIYLDMDDADAELTNCKGSSFTFVVDDGDINMDGGIGSLDVRGDDADVTIRNANFTSIDATMDDGDLIIETSLADNGDYIISTEDGTIVLNITRGGGQFDIRHDDARVITEGNFKVVEEGENKTRAGLANGNAKVRLSSDDGRIRLTAQ